MQVGRPSAGRASPSVVVDVALVEMIDWHGLVPTESELASDPTSRARAGPGEEGGGSAMGEDEQAREALWLHKGERPKEQALVTVCDCRALWFDCSSDTLWRWCSPSMYEFIIARAEP